jgi:hypothetical protein
MFPQLYESTQNLVPEIYFGGQEVPPYCHLRVPTGGPLEELVAAIRSVGTVSNCSGYIDGEGVHFHLSDGDNIRVDLSREFVFVSQPGDTEDTVPSAWQVMFFLMEPARKVLFVGAHDAMLLEKTRATLQLCLALDQMWAQDFFLGTRQAMVESDEAREGGLARLMKIHEEESVGTSSEMWEFWDVFGGCLMQERLGMRVETLAIPPAE